MKTQSVRFRNESDGIKRVESQGETIGFVYRNVKTRDWTTDIYGIESLECRRLRTLKIAINLHCRKMTTSQRYFESLA